MLGDRSRKTIRTTVPLVGALALSLILGGVSLGQIKSGAIVGIVSDPSGAVVQGANVSVVNQETNVAATAVTDEAGRLQ